MRYKCTVSYDGTNFHGFQIQGTLRTVQLEIENVLKKVLKNDVKIYGAGRTDSKVHAINQVFHFDSDIEMKDSSMKKAINAFLPDDIYIKNVEIVNEEFHSRFSSHEKNYHYIIDLGEYNPLYNNYRYYYKYKLDIDKMIDASQVFIGEHDFKSFTKNKIIENTVRTIYSINFIKENEGKLVTIEFIGNGFLHNMIRIIVAMLIEVGNGRKTKEDLINIMENKNRIYAPKTAPANGLYLYYIKYNN